MDTEGWCHPTSCRLSQRTLQQSISMLSRHQSKRESPRYRCISVRLHTLPYTEHNHRCHNYFLFDFSSLACCHFLFCLFNLALWHFFCPTVSRMALYRSSNEVFTLRPDRKCFQRQNCSRSVITTSVPHSLPVYINRTLVLHCSFVNILLPPLDPVF